MTDTDLRFVDDGREGLPYYKEQDWSKQYWREYHIVEKTAIRYQPYTVWRTAAYQGRTINVDSRGLRSTPGTSCDPESLSVFMFGGSTVWGTGVPDWGTLPAYLQMALDSYLDRPVCVVNYGEQGYVSTQSVIELLLALRGGKSPNLVIFYDGSNDVFAAYQSSRAGVHQNLSQVAARFENRDEISPTIRLLSSTRTFSLVQRFGKKHEGFEHVPFLPSQSRNDTDELADAILDVYLGNYQIVKALSVYFDFKYHFFWQPNLLTENKALTDEEAAIRDVAAGVYPGISQLFEKVRERINRAAQVRRHLHNVDSVFAAQSNLVYIDPWHVTMEGNELLAAVFQQRLTGLR